MIETGLGDRLKKGIAWNLVAAAFNQGSTFAVNVAVANLLGGPQFGEFAILLTTVATLVGVAQLGAGYTATRYVSEYRDTDKPKAGRILGLCSLLSAITSVLASGSLLLARHFLAANVLRTPGLAASLAVCTGAVLFGVVCGYQAGALAGLESYRALGICGILSGLTYFLACTLGAWRYGLSGALAGLVVSGLVQWSVLSFSLRREMEGQGVTLTYRGVWAERRLLFRFALPSALSGFVLMPSIWIASAFLARQSGGFQQIALYSAASNLKNGVLFLPNVTNTVGMSVLNNQKGLANALGFKKTLAANLGLTVASVCAGVLGVVALGRPLLSLFGRDFAAGYPVLKVVMLAALLEAVGIAAYQVLQSREQIWLSLGTIVIPRGLVLVFLSFLWSPRHGALGLAWAYAIACALALAVTLAVGKFGVPGDRVPLASPQAARGGKPTP